MSLRHIETGKTWEREMVGPRGVEGYSYGETFCGRWFWYGQRRSWATKPGKPLEDATCQKCIKRWNAETVPP